MMKRRLAAVITIGLLTIGLGAAPAHAGAPGYVKQGSYGWGDQCLGIGYYGQTNHSWQAYYCETVMPSGATGPGLYTLWVQY
jgi:hypothetical protein